MKIGIDGNEANVKNRVGVNTYAYELLIALNKINKEHEFSIFLKDKPLPDMPKERENWKYVVLAKRPFWILTSLTPFLLKEKNLYKNSPEVLLSPSHYTPFLVNIPKICSIMDLGYLKSKAQFNLATFWQLKYWTAISINTSKYIIAISEATKNDIVRHYPGASKKIRVTHLAYDKDKFNQKKSHINVRRRDFNKLQSKHNITNEYLLYLGTLKPSKNIEGIIKAFSIIKKTDDKKLKLVIAGKRGWMFESIFELVKSLKLEDDVIFTGFVSESTKIALMQEAKLLVSPSFWEGFGLHVLESLAIGTPVVISKAGSMQEVGGDAAIYVDPKNPESIAEGIKKILSMNNTKYQNLKKTGVKWSEKFSWERTARETLSIIESATKD